SYHLLILEDLLLPQIRLLLGLRLHSLKQAREQQEHHRVNSAQQQVTNGNEESRRVHRSVIVRFSKRLDLVLYNLRLLISLCSELGSELTFLAGSELRTSELDTSELNTSEYMFLKIFILMANLSEDIQCANSDTRPPMLDRTDFALLAKTNSTVLCGVKRMGRNEGALHLGPERPRVYSDLSPEDKDSLNSKFVNNMLLEWGRFVTVVKLNRGLRDSNYDQLYAYLKQHEAHANENKMMLERFTQPNVDPLALISNVSHQQYNSQSSINPSSTYVPPHFIDNSQLN
ncbi:hypothetical protein Tco_0679821, partial [Tanacetum coccineum]